MISIYPQQESKNTEIERKFLLEFMPDLYGYDGTDEIKQGYIVADENIEVRLRSKGKKFYETVKTAGNILRKEYEIELTKNQFNTLWPLTNGKRLLKDRYFKKEKNLTYEIDVYKGIHEGLIILEVEFSSIRESQRFKVPSWTIREVTYDNQFKNKNLAVLRSIDSLLGY